MTSVRERRRRKKEEQARRAARRAAEGAQGTTPLPTSPKQAIGRARGLSEALTEWQAKRAGYRVGDDGVVRRLDMIGFMHAVGYLTSAEEQAARMFQEAYRAYLAEIGTRGYGSCLADNMAGYVGDDGRADVIASYRRIEARIGLLYTSHLATEVFRTLDERPHLPGWTKAALKALAS